MASCHARCVNGVNQHLRTIRVLIDREYFPNNRQVMVLEMVVYSLFNHLMWLLAWGRFIEFTCCGSFRLYIL
jgi:hypothetical protein